jgi:excisionase family DNA binding protein
MTENKSSFVPPETEAPWTYSVPEAGRLLGLSRNAAYDAARRHEIPCLRFGRKLRVPRVALERLLRGEANAIPGV